MASSYIEEHDVRVDHLEHEQTQIQTGKKIESNLLHPLPSLVPIPTRKPPTKVPALSEGIHGLEFDNAKLVVAVTTHLET